MTTVMRPNLYRLYDVNEAETLPKSTHSHAVDVEPLRVRVFGDDERTAFAADAHMYAVTMDDPDDGKFEPWYRDMMHDLREIQLTAPEFDDVVEWPCDHCRLMVRTHTNTDPCPHCRL